MSWFEVVAVGVFIWGSQLACYFIGKYVGRNER